MCSLILTHIILAAHRTIIKAQKPPNMYISTDSNIEKKKEPLCIIAFSSRLAMAGVTLLLLLSICFLVMGSYYISFEFNFRGAAALALSYLSESTRQTYSLITLGLRLPYSSPNPDSFGIRWIQVTFFLFALVIPLLHLLFVLTLWLIPLTRKIQRRIYVVTEILNAWSAIDVFVVSVIASLLEISQFAQFIIGDRCDLINVYLKAYFDEALQGEDKCFDVITKLETGCWLLFSGCIFYLISSIVVMRACHRALSKRDNSLQRTPTATSQTLPPQVDSPQTYCEIHSNK